jgi:trypsin
MTGVHSRLLIVAAPSQRPFVDLALLRTLLGLGLTALVACTCRPSGPGPGTGSNGGVTAPTSPTTTTTTTTTAPLAQAGAPNVPPVTEPDTPAEPELATCDTAEARALPRKRELRKVQPRIVGGKESALGAHPWMAALSENGTNAYCGGALIGKDWVLTAAHCQVSLTDKVILGRQDLSKTTDGKAVQVSEVKTHAKYNDKTQDFDVALVRIKDASSLPLLELYDGSADLAAEAALIVGWGRTKEQGPLSPKLREVSVPILTNAACAEKYKNEVTITERMLCAGVPEGKKDSCQGDSGGPLLVMDKSKLVQAGIVSFGIGCARPEIPGVYTRLAKVRSWIKACTR